MIGLVSLEFISVVVSVADLHTAQSIRAMQVCHQNCLSILSCVAFPLKDHPQRLLGPKIVPLGPSVAVSDSCNFAGFLLSMFRLCRNSARVFVAHVTAKSEDLGESIGDEVYSSWHSATARAKEDSGSGGGKYTLFRLSINPSCSLQKFAMFRCISIGQFC